jgi:DNA-binding MarR family transcriptional regulator
VTTRPVGLHADRLLCRRAAWLFTRDISSGRLRCISRGLAARRERMMKARRSSKQFSIGQYPMYVMGRIMYKHIHIMTESLKGTEYGFSHWRVLSILKEHPSLTVQEFSELMPLDRTALGRLLDSMEGQGLVSSAVAERDRRHRHVSITETGLAAFEQMLPAVQRQLERAVDGLSAEEVEQLIALLQRIRQNLDRSPFLDWTAEATPR